MKQKTSRLEVRVSADDKENIARICLILDVPKGQFVRDAIRQHINNHIVKLMLQDDISAEGIAAKLDILHGEGVETVSNDNQQGDVYHDYRRR